jgi:hypothetical protein
MKTLMNAMKAKTSILKNLPNITLFQFTVVALAILLTKQVSNYNFITLKQDRYFTKEEQTQVWLKCLTSKKCFVKEVAKKHHYSLTKESLIGKCYGLKSIKPILIKEVDLHFQDLDLICY